MSRYRYLGYGITNNGGVAKLDHDAQGNPVQHSYTGSGAGELDIVASLDNPITDRSLVSERFSIHDCILKDIATSSNHNDAMWIIVRGSLSRGTEDTEIVLNNGQNNVMLYFNLTNTDSFAIEFDAIWDYSTNHLAQLRDNDWNVLFRINPSSYSKDTWHHVKIELDNGTAKAYVDGISASSGAVTGVSMFNFIKTSTDNYIRYKNFEYYPI